MVGNTGAVGGGLSVIEFSIVTQCNFVQNSVEGDSGFVQGGALFASSDVEITNSKFTSNVAMSLRGSMFQRRDFLVLALTLCHVSLFSLFFPVFPSFGSVSLLYWLVGIPGCKSLDSNSSLIYCSCRRWGNQHFRLGHLTKLPAGR